MSPAPKQIEATTPETGLFLVDPATKGNYLPLPMDPNQPYRKIYPAQNDPLLIPVTRVLIEKGNEVKKIENIKGYFATKSGALVGPIKASYADRFNEIAQTAAENFFDRAQTFETRYFELGGETIQMTLEH